MSRLIAVLGCLCAVAALAHSAAVPTQDTMVVAKSDDTIATSSSTPSVADITTEEPSPPIKLTEMDVVSDVSLRYAHTTVVAKVRNPAKKAQEANFRVLLPETAFISGFIMTLDGKSYKAYVKEKEEAKQIYQDAVNQGIGAAHISAKARDSNHFTVSVNVEASSNAVFNLTYEELLVRRNGVYNHAINLHPGALVPKLTVTVNIKETEKLVELRVPEIRTGNEIDATKDDAQNQKVTITRAHDDREATITFTPDLQEQERLIQIYAQKAKDSAANSHSYSSWSSYSEPEESAVEGVLGQFVVQYDVARPKDGEILVNDGYFVHFFAPTELPPLNKFVVFVLDTSGSMMDRKIIQLREAMQTILSELNEGDYFSIVEFASVVTVHDLKEAEGEPPKNSYSYSYFDYHDKGATLLPPSKATKENINKAKVIVSWLQAAGGTNIGKALDVAVELINKGVDWTLPAPVAGVPANATETSTTEAVGTEATTTSTTTTTTQATVTTEVGEKKEPKNLEPIIIFLTDGDPTVGETDPKRIITRVQEKNFGPNKATIFSLAFGEDADRKFLRKLSLRNGGFMRHIYEAADSALQLRDFYRQISSPLLADLKFTYPSGQVKADSLTQHKFRTYYAGSELVVAGQVLDDVPELQPTVLAFCGVSDGYGRKRYEIVPKIPVEKKKAGYLPLERLWSYLTIKQLLDERDASDGSESEDKENSPEKKALALALKYEFVTPLTSLVVVKPNATNAVNAESVDKTAGGAYPSSIPLSVSLAGRPMASHASQAFSISAGAFGLPGAPGLAYPAAAPAGYGGAGGFASLDSLPVADLALEEEIDEYALEGSGLTRSSYSDIPHAFSFSASRRPASSSWGHSYPSSSWGQSYPSSSSGHSYPSSSWSHSYPSSSSSHSYPSSSSSQSYPSSSWGQSHPSLSWGHSYPSPSWGQNAQGSAFMPQQSSLIRPGSSNPAHDSSPNLSPDVLGSGLTRSSYSSTAHAFVLPARRRLSSSSRRRLSSSRRRGQTRSMHRDFKQDSGITRSSYSNKPHAFSFSAKRRPASSSWSSLLSQRTLITPLVQPMASPVQSYSDLATDYDDVDSSPNLSPDSGLPGSSSSYNSMPAFDLSASLRTASNSWGQNAQGSLFMQKISYMRPFSSYSDPALDVDYDIDSSPNLSPDSHPTTPFAFFAALPTTVRPIESSAAQTSEPATALTSVPTSSRPTLAELRLEGFTWIEALLDASADNIILPTNDTSVTLKLSKDLVAPKEANACINAVPSGSGLCVYLSRCDIAKDITVDVYRTTYCTLSLGYAGVCCPRDKINLTD